MKLKYYLRGLGIGIIVTTILLMIAFALHKPTMSDADIIARAKQLGMVMPEDEEPLQDTETTESTEVTAVPETEAAGILICRVRQVKVNACFPPYQDCRLCVVSKTAQVEWKE